jgi:cytochrome c nitrite reductase small subunit
MPVVSLTWINSHVAENTAYVVSMRAATFAHRSGRGFDGAMPTRDASSGTRPARGVAGVAVLAALAGALLGVGAYTFHYAHGFSYLSSDPEACVNCHIMRPQYDSWQKSSHHAVAKCVDCHLPHDLVGKYVAKAGNGWHHSRGFTLQDFHEPIVIKPNNAAILQANCIACHGDLVHELVGGVNGDPDEVQCVHCHAGVGHGETAGLGGPGRADEIEGDTT